jgi:hypothetical protein
MDGTVDASQEEASYNTTREVDDHEASTVTEAGARPDLLWHMSHRLPTADFFPVGQSYPPQLEGQHRDKCHCGPRYD